MSGPGVNGTDTSAGDGRYLGATVTIPQHVLHRSFEAETIVLNLEIGEYLGLNPTAGRMLELLRELGSVGAVADRMAQEYEVSPDELRRDVCLLVEQLLEHGLVELDEPLD